MATTARTQEEILKEKALSLMKVKLTKAADAIPGTAVSYSTVESLTATKEELYDASQSSQEEKGSQELVELFGVRTLTREKLSVLLRRVSRDSGTLTPVTNTGALTPVTNTYSEADDGRAQTPVMETFVEEDEEDKKEKEDNLTKDAAELLPKSGILLIQYKSKSKSLDLITSKFIEPTTKFSDKVRKRKIDERREDEDSLPHRKSSDDEPEALKTSEELDKDRDKDKEDQSNENVLSKRGRL